MDISGANETAKVTNEFFKKHPTARDTAEKIAMATTVAAPGGVVIGPAMMYVVNKKKSNKLRNKIKDKIKSGYARMKREFIEKGG